MNSSTQTSPAALELQDLSYSYRTDWLRKRVLALKNISLTVSAGEAFGFLGHNGAGKTTSIKCILGLTKISSGTIKIFGKDASSIESRNLIGYLPEQPYFYDYLTVREIMHLYATLRGVPASERIAEIDSTLERLAILDRAETRMRALSKGLMQRVAMAQAILGKPKILILDEPFSGLDPVGRKEFRDLLLELKRSGTTLFMSSHILGDIEFLCDRASIMVKGELRGVFNLRDLSRGDGAGFELALQSCAATQPQLDAELRENTSEHSDNGHILRLKYATRHHAESALRRAMGAGLAVERFEPLHQNLEDIFMSLLQKR